MVACLIWRAMSNKIAQLLKNVIMERGIPMGTTTNGADWCLKALHPSDPQTEVHGIPDRSAVPSLLMNYQSTFSLSPTPGATGTWQFDASLLPHPIDFMYVTSDDSVIAGQERNFLNSQLLGADHANKYLSFIAMVQRWRLAYMSVTCYQDGPDLANQGSIVVAQVPTMPVRYNFSGPNYFPATGSLVSFPTVEEFMPEDRPNFVVSQGMPNAYFSRSREGAYVPLKLTETCQDWVSDAERVCTAKVTKFSTLPTESVYVLPTTSTISGFPHFSMIAAYYNGITQTSFAQATSPMLNGTWANISARNLSVATSFTFFVRCGIEMQVQPSSSIAPQLALSPQHDQQALDCYFAIARELKDGYPSDYNDLGKIWDAISAASKKALPLLKNIPGFGIPSQLIGGAVTAGDWMRKAGKGGPNPKKKKGPAKKKVLLLKGPQPKNQPRGRQMRRTNPTSARQEERSRRSRID